MWIEIVTVKCVRLRPVCLRVRPSEAITAPSLATHHHLAFMLAFLHACLISVLPPIETTYSLHTAPSWGRHDSVSELAYMSVECVCHILAVKPAADALAC